MRPPKLVRYPGLKEEYYLADHVIDDGRARASSGLDPGRLIAVVRPPPEVTLYHRGASTDLFAATLARLLGAAPAVQTVVLPRTDEQRAAPRRAGRRSCPSARSTGPAWWPPPTWW